MSGGCRPSDTWLNLPREKNNLGVDGGKALGEPAVASEKLWLLCMDFLLSAPLGRQGTLVDGDIISTAVQEATRAADMLKIMRSDAELGEHHPRARSYLVCVSQGSCAVDLRYCR